MTEIYFIRHAESDHHVKDEYNRPLTAKGIADAKKLPELFKPIYPAACFCSPYIRTFQTVCPVAVDKHLDVIVKHNLRERESTSAWIHNDMDLTEFVHRMWADQSKGVDGGESIAELQRRNIREINSILKAYEGSALASIINYYKPEFSGDDFMKFIRVMPYIMKMVFDKNECNEMEEVPASPPADKSR
jgi:2,3-bisphosphoglycerate-dependent phosphoglycerate mutase